MKGDRIRQIESYVKQSMETVMAPDLRIAHDFKHVDRVRGWALRIARGEAFQDLELVEAAAWLHDIGLTRVEVEQRRQHGQVGAYITALFLQGAERPRGVCGCDRRMGIDFVAPYSGL